LVSSPKGTSARPDEETGRHRHGNSNRLKVTDSHAHQRESGGRTSVELVSMGIRHFQTIGISRGDVGPGFPSSGCAGPFRRGNQGQTSTRLNATRKKIQDPEEKTERPTLERHERWAADSSKSLQGWRNCANAPGCGNDRPPESIRAVGDITMVDVGVTDAKRSINPKALHQSTASIRRSCLNA